MKLFIASDIHGSEYYCRKMIERYKEEEYDKIILLGDILYHGPRNDLPRGYSPKEVISLLNELADKIICVRGNCDTEVDQMVLDFPVMSEYSWVLWENKAIILTHGHKEYKELCRRGTTIFCGHTHIPEYREEDGILYINPGSVSIPKEGSPHSYMTYDGEKFEWRRIEDGGVYITK